MANLQKNSLWHSKMQLQTKSEVPTFSRKVQNIVYLKRIFQLIKSKPGICWRSVLMWKTGSVDILLLKIRRTIMQLITLMMKVKFAQRAIFIVGGKCPPIVMVSLYIVRYRCIIAIVVHLNSELPRARRMFVSSQLSRWSIQPRRDCEVWATGC